MAVYVDDAVIPAKVRNGRVVHDSQWSHLVAATPRELHDFATRTLGLQRAYFQDHWPYPHYDLTSGKRIQALANGAVEINYGDPGALGLGRWLPPVLVTSSRDGVEVTDVEEGLRPHFDPRKVLIAGGARGGDRMAASLWQVWGGEVDEDRVSPAAWQKSRGAGYDRNARMVTKTAERGGECVALVAPCTDERCRRTEPHGTHGASHRADLAHDAGLKVYAPAVGGKPSAWQPKPEPAKHDWQPTDERNRKECACGVTAVRTPAQSSTGWRVEFFVPDLPGTPELPPHFGMEKRISPAPARRAQSAPQPAAEEEELTPAAGSVLRQGTYYETVQCGCGSQFRRPPGASYAECLHCELAAKTAAAGPEVRAGVAQLASWNAGVMASGPAAAPAADRQRERGADREAGS